MREMLTNEILTGLPEAEFARLMPALKPVSLSAGENLTRAAEAARFVYFPEGAVLSCHADMSDGKTVEVGMIGREGAAGLLALSRARSQVHSLNVLSQGSALRIECGELERVLDRAEGLRRSLLSYACEYVTQVSQRAACNALNLIEQRLAVWLLLITERLGADTLCITQEVIAQHLGVRRAGISVIAGELQGGGLISYTRGSMRVRDRRALETVACECYAAMRAQGRDRVAA